MKLPNAENAVIAQGKLCDYLLNPALLRGGSKARQLIALGYTAVDWQRLESDLRSQHLIEDVVGQTATDYGVSYAIVAPLGKVVTLRSVWQTLVRTTRD